MLTDKFLLKTAVLSAILGLLGLYFFPPSTSEELMLIELVEAYKSSEGTLVNFFILEQFSGYYKGNLSPGSYYVTASRGGNNFYYISAFKNINGSN